MEERVEELEKAVGAFMEIIKGLAQKIGSQDTQMLEVLKLLTELLNKTEKKKEENGLRNK